METENTPYELSTVFIDSIDGLMAKLRILATPPGRSNPIPAIFVNDDLFRGLAKQNINSLDSYPALGVDILSVGPDTENYNEQVSRQLGLLIDRDRSGGIDYKFKFVPVLAEISVKYIAQNRSDVLFFIQKWMLSSREMQFSLVQKSASINIRVTLDKNITLSDIEYTDTGNRFTYTGALALHTYMGIIEQNKTITSVNVESMLANNNKIPDTRTTENFVIKRKPIQDGNF